MKIRRNTPDEEAAIQRGIAQDRDNPEIASGRSLRPAAEMLPAAVHDAVVRRRGPGKRPAKVPVTIKLRPDVLQALRASGPGWQGRAAEALAILANKPAEREKLS